MERQAFRVSGFIMFVVLLLAIGGSWALLRALAGNGALIALTGVCAAIVVLLLVSGFTVISPNEARVMQFFGRYAGSISTAGFHWTVPLSNKTRLSLRV